MTEWWPELDYEADRPVIESLHAYLQVVGKLPTRALPWCNHSWQLAMRVVPRGFRTYPVEMADGEAEVLFDCLSNAVMVETSAGFTERFGVAGQSVARFHEQLTDLLRRAGATTDISGGPNEVEEAIPFREDTADREWDAATLTRIRRIASGTLRRSPASTAPFPTPVAFSSGSDQASSANRARATCSGAVSTSR